ncbi:hypothetical protein [Burkholderia cepacia]|uniref:hypothetical protein n=2 Tax=Burkholderia cepacia TaxID=292 RepID=UPI002ABD369A|nr:hypothetical protein [Burkholderia cepacia]
MTELAGMRRLASDDAKAQASKRIKIVAGQGSVPVALPAGLVPVREAFPRQNKEANLAYARRLNLASQRGQPGARVGDQPLSLDQLASLSGAPKFELRRAPQLVALPAELVPVREAFPRQNNETNFAYARRLNLASQRGEPGARVGDQPLSLDRLASLSGVKKSGLTQDPQLVALPAELVPVREAFPRQNKEANIAYARRLNLASQRGQPGARIGDQPLSLDQLASLSGAPKFELRRDPQLVALPAELVPVREAFPRQNNETNLAYARRLNLASQRGQPGARVGGQSLSLDQLASLSGAQKSNLHRDPQLVALPAELVPVREAFPRQNNEANLVYARRLNLASQRGEPGTRIGDQPLSLDQLASLSGAIKSHLIQDPQLVALPAELAPVREAFPRQGNEKNIAYARRLNLASQRGQPGARVGDQPLSLDQLASLSGAKKSDLTQDPQLVALPAELVPVREAFPRQGNEANLAYARRLNLASQWGQPGARIGDQPLSLDQLASVSGAPKFELRRDPQLVALPAELVPVREAYPRQNNEANLAYARRLNLASQRGQPGARVGDQPLNLDQLSSLSGAKKSDLSQARSWPA